MTGALSFDATASVLYFAYGNAVGGWVMAFLAAIALAAVALAVVIRLRPRRHAVEPPQNVVAVMPDGSEIPLEFVYAGKRKGMDHWQSAWVLSEMPVEVRGGRMPGRSSLEILARKRGES